LSLVRFDDAENPMVKISPDQYLAEMRQVEEQRNAACRQGDLATIKAVIQRKLELNRRCWGRARS
jgi:hypothetical protein